MAETALSLFVVGLRNAHALENQALSIMRPQESRIEHYPQLAQRLREHIAETEIQIQRLESILDGLGEDKSGLKDLALSLSGTIAALSHSVAPDEILKNSFANNAFENFEIAAYKSLIVMAQQAGRTDAIPLLTESLREEQAMAAWMDQNIEPVTLQYIALRAAGETAKK